MRRLAVGALLILWSLAPEGLAATQHMTAVGDNAALRYWAAFSQVQDSTLTKPEAKELSEILEGTAPYVDAKYKDLLEKNKPALETMQHGTTLSTCDWGLDYSAGAEVPVDYARQALVLGRLNVLYSLHLLLIGDKDGGVRALVSGLRFSKDVANGGTIFATVIAKDLMASHLRAIGSALQLYQLSSTQRQQLQAAVAHLGEGLDWRNAAKHEVESLQVAYVRDPQALRNLKLVALAYQSAVSDPSQVNKLEEAIAAAPPEIAKLIPSAKKVLEQKKDLGDLIAQTRSSLR